MKQSIQAALYIVSAETVIASIVSAGLFLLLVTCMGP